MPVEIRHTETDRGSYCNKEDGQKYLDGEGTFFNGNESDDSDNEDENYNENNEQQQLSQGFANNCDKIVSPVFLQELINDFAVCKHCSGTQLVQKQSPRGVLLKGFIEIS